MGKKTVALFGVLFTLMGEKKTGLKFYKMKCLSFSTFDNIRQNVLPSGYDFDFKPCIVGTRLAPTGIRKHYKRVSCMKQQIAGEKKGLIGKEQRGAGRTRRYVIKG